VRRCTGVTYAVAVPELLPRPTAYTAHPGHFTILPGTGVTGPAPIADLVRELLGPATGFGFPQRDPGLTFTIVEDPELGAEGYRLSVTPDGISASGTETGLRWAVQTLRQLLPEAVLATEIQADARWEIPCVEIVDVPHYPWRGALLDVARWCHPLPFLYRFVDLMALHKLNTLHLHLTDDQGWRFEVLKYPRLTEVGATRRESPVGHYRDGRFDGTPHGGFYTQDQLRDLVAYALRRGVRIMPEIDVPGHMQAALTAYPWLGNEPDRPVEVRTAWGISSRILNVTDETVDFVRHVLDELVTVFPFELVHLGGDEVPPDEWLASPAAQAKAAALGLSTVEDLLGWWSGQLADHLAGYGRRAAYWDEVLDRGAPPGSLLFGWRDEDRVAAAQAAGFEVVAVPQSYLYLDWAESDGPDEPLSIRPGLPLEKVYSYQPGAVLGVQGQLWSEYLPTPELVEWRAFPRLAAAAEVGWTAPQPRDFTEFRTRLAGHLARLDVLKVNYRPLD
jgi:hexosaminidase